MIQRCTQKIIDTYTIKEADGKTPIKLPDGSYPAERDGIHVGVANQEFDELAEREVILDFPKIEINRQKEIPYGNWKPLKEIITFTGD